MKQQKKKVSFGKSFSIRKGKNKIVAFVKSNRKNIIVSLVISGFLLFVGYFTNNMSLFTGEKLGIMASLETINRLCGVNTEYDTDSVIYINTSFDKALIPYYQIDVVSGEKLKPLGNTEITDRRKLVELLELLEGVNYKYLILDVRFAKGLECDTYVTDSITGEKVKVDDKLTSLINRLDRVVIPTHHDDRHHIIRLLNSELERKAALADYKSTATATNFIRYEYFDSIPYIPLKVYNDLNKAKGLDTIACHYPLGTRKWKAFAIYTQGYRLCYNSLFLDFKIRNDDSKIEVDRNPYPDVDFLNLSNDILNVSERECIVRSFENKYIFIGDYLQDIHDTYAGNQPGGVILYNAIKALNANKHIISIFEIVILFLLYFSISLFILVGKNILNLIKKSDNPLLNFIIDTASFTIILCTYQIAEYILGRTSYSFVIPIITFTIIKTYVLLKEKYNMKKNFFAVLLALVLGLLMSFSSIKNDNEGVFKVHTYNSDLIYIDGKKISQGMIISPNSHIKFIDSRQWIKLLNVGNDYIIRYGKNNEMKDIWKKGEYRKMGGYNESKKVDLLWWIKWNMTSTKGDGSLFDDVEYLIGNNRVFEIEDTIKNRSEQEYKFEVIDGKNKGRCFYANPDDKDLLIWLSRDVFNKYGIFLNEDSECDSLKVNVIYRSFSETDTLKRSMILKIIKL